MPISGSKENIQMLDRLCEDYLPRVFRYACYWVSDRVTAEELTLKALKGSMAISNVQNGISDAADRVIFTRARQTIQNRSSENIASLSGISREEREVISLKLGAELSNASIAGILSLPEPRVGSIICSSLGKSSGS